MGGHGGLNILPQKKWNVYNFENREKVRKDEEAAAREEQLKREQSRRRDAEFRLDRLRQARGIHSSSSSAAARNPSSDSGHINLFSSFADLSSEESPAAKKFQKEDDKGGKKRKREEAAPPVVGPEDEKYKLGYGLVGKGVKTPWYLSRPAEDVDREIERSDTVLKGPAKKSGGKKSIEELREERVKRERKEKERERAVLNSVAKKGGERGLSRRKS